jgi:DNA-binding LacI/PurR family transcriptional regulator
LPGSRVTIRDVAAAAGVHASTVSRILRGSSDRPSPSRERVLDVARRLGYQPNLLARALTEQRAPFVPLLIPDVANAFFPAVALGAEEAARQAGYALLLCNTESETDLERRYLESLVPLQVPFVIVVPNSETSVDTLREFAASCPMVIVDRLLDGLDLPSVSVDNRLGGRLATDHLLDLGHTRVACIAGPQDASTARDRLHGYALAMEDRSLEPVIIQGGFTTQDGTRAARAFLRLRPRPTAVTAANDLAALAFVRELEAHGVRVPGDVSVVGFDDLIFAAYSRPALTTIHQPARRMGQRAIEVALASGPDGHLAHVRLRPHLVVRESTGPVA